MRRGMTWVVTLLVIFTVPAFLGAQTATTARLSGNVTDPTGAVLPGASVELADTATGATVSVTTNAAGQYTFPTASPGTYTITVTMQGFRTATVVDFKMEVAKGYAQNFMLEVGVVTEVIEISSEATVELQTSDAQIGGVVGGESILRLPSLGRSAGEFLTLQPGVIPTVSFGFGNEGGAVTGARSDQSTFSLDGIDISDNVVGGGGRINTVIPIPVDSVEEFRVGVANANATFGRSAGAQVALIGRRGSNSLHGAAYWYHQNDNLNANSWTNNRNDIEEAELKDNRYGLRVGGPILPERAFFFINYEGRDFPRQFNVTRIVPSNEMRQGILRFRDAAGNVVSYSLASSTLCGTNNTDQCDPRGLGLSPTVAAMWAGLPQGNDPSADGADGLNTIGFRDTMKAPLENDFIVGRFDFNFTDKWRLNTSYTYFRRLSDSNVQVDLSSGRARPGRTSTDRPSALTAALNSQLTSSLTSNFRFGWIRDRGANVAFSPSASAEALAIPGSATSAGAIALDAGNRGFTGGLDELIDVDTQRARTQLTTSENFQFAEDMTWVKGKHTIQFGGNIRYMPTIHDRNDKVVGSLTSLVAFMDDASFISIPDTSRPPTCSSSVTTNCIEAGDVTNWNDSFAWATGMVDNISVLTAFDGDLAPLPLGTSLVADTTLWAYEFYAQDTWRVSPSFTLTYGLSYQWQTPPKEKLGRQTFVINNDNGEIISAASFLEQKRQAALSGQIFNPELAYLPINSSSRSKIFDIDRNNWGPRLSAAWNPSFSSGVGGALFGDRKTVLRGGFGVAYDRLNTVQSVIIPMLGVGFAQTLSINGPNCDASGTAGAGCVAGGADPSSAFRVGVDGSIPLPTASPLTAPVVPPCCFSELLSFQVDPDFGVGVNYSGDFTIQRELPGDMLLEVGWAGRWGRNLNQSRNLNAVPYFHVDPTSGQSFAQAFDFVATQLRNGVPGANVTVQPWFENMLGPGGTVSMASNFGSEFVDGLIADMWLFGIDFMMANPVNNLQALELFMRGDGGKSNYHGLLLTLHKRMSRGFTFSFNYTMSKSLDQVGAVQNTAGYFPNPYDLNTDYGNSFFDRTHVWNATWLYELPLGAGRGLSTGNWFDKVIGGWYISNIFTRASGLPDTVAESDQVYGGGVIFGFNTAAIPTRDPDSMNNSPQSPVFGSNGVGTSGDPANGGSGINRFADPNAVFNSFRPILLGQDGRSGRGNPLRGFGNWNLDMSLGKKTSIKERVDIVFSFDMFNIFNKVDFFDGSTNLQERAAFGVVTEQSIPANRTSGSRWIQFGFRVEF